MLMISINLGGFLPTHNHIVLQSEFSRLQHHLWTPSLSQPASQFLKCHSCVFFFTSPNKVIKIKKAQRHLRGVVVYYREGNYPVQT